MKLTADKRVTIEAKFYCPDGKMRIVVGNRQYSLLKETEPVVNKYSFYNELELHYCSNEDGIIAYNPSNSSRKEEQLFFCEEGLIKLFGFVPTQIDYVNWR